MRYKRITLTGSFMIASVVVLGVLMYYFNQGKKKNIYFNLFFPKFIQNNVFFLLVLKIKIFK